MKIKILIVGLIFLISTAQCAGSHEGIDVIVTKHESHVQNESALVAFAQECIEYGKIIGLSTASAIVYGIVHDQITARICPEYFNSSLHKPHRDFLCDVLGYKDPSKLSPTQLGLIFGVCATWWVGAGLGFPLAFAARAGNYPKLEAKDLIKPAVVLLTGMGLGSLIAGYIGYQQHQERVRGSIFGIDLLRRFEGVGYAHNTSYLLGALGGICLCLWVIHERKRLDQEQQPGHKQQQHKYHQQDFESSATLFSSSAT